MCASVPVTRAMGRNGACVLHELVRGRCGRGVTSARTMAMVAVAAGTPYRIPSGRRMQVHLASDVAHLIP